MCPLLNPACRESDRRLLSDRPLPSHPQGNCRDAPTRSCLPCAVACVRGILRGGLSSAAPENERVPQGLPWLKIIVVHFCYVLSWKGYPSNIMCAICDYLSSNQTFGHSCETLWKLISRSFIERVCVCVWKVNIEELWRLLHSRLQVYCVNGVIREVAIGEKLVCEREPWNTRDCYAIAVNWNIPCPATHEIVMRYLLVEPFLVENISCVQSLWSGEWKILNKNFLIYSKKMVGCSNCIYLIRYLTIGPLIRNELVFIIVKSLQWIQHTLKDDVWIGSSATNTQINKRLDCVVCKRRD